MKTRPFLLRFAIFLTVTYDLVSKSAMTHKKIEGGVKEKNIVYIKKHK